MGRTKLLSMLTAVCFFFGLLAIPLTAEAFIYNRAWERSVKQEVLQDSIKRDGLSKDETDNAMLNRVTGRLMPAVKSKESIDLEYTFFVNQKKQANAYSAVGGNISVNLGMFEAVNYNEDELAFIVAHEMGHTQGQHMIKTLNGAVGFGLLAYLYLERNQNTASQLLTGVVYNNILKKGYGLAHEWDADGRGFAYATAAGYNPASGAAAFQRLTEQHGDKNYNLLGDVLLPEEHPSNKQRIAKFMEQTKTYSGNRVSANGTAVILMDKAVIFPSKLPQMSAAERSYLIAGNFARALHDLGKPVPVTITDNGELFMGNYRLMTVTDGDGDAETLVRSINEVLRV